MVPVLVLLVFITAVEAQVGAAYCGIAPAVTITRTRLRQSAAVPAQSVLFGLAVPAARLLSRQRVLERK